MIIVETIRDFLLSSHSLLAAGLESENNIPSGNNKTNPYGITQSRTVEINMKLKPFLSNFSATKRR